jgi:hypothetical protein
MTEMVLQITLQLFGKQLRLESIESHTTGSPVNNSPTVHHTGLDYTFSKSPCASGSRRHRNPLALQPYVDQRQMPASRRYILVQELESGSLIQYVTEKSYSSAHPLTIRVSSWHVR